MQAPIKHLSLCERLTESDPIIQTGKRRHIEDFSEKMVGSGFDPTHSDSRVYCSLSLYDQQPESVPGYENSIYRK